VKVEWLEKKLADYLVDFLVVLLVQRKVGY